MSAPQQSPGSPGRPRPAAQPHPLTHEVVVLGAGMTGLTVALLLTRAGHRVTVLDRDPAGPPASGEAAWQSWRRPGVNQFRQLHVVLPRWRALMQDCLPDVLTTLDALGGVTVNLLHLQPEQVTAGWRPGDERFDTLTARRPVLEAALARVAATEPGLLVRRGCTVTGLLTVADRGRPPRVVGVQTAEGPVRADLVVDAGGRHTPLAGWAAALGAGPRVDRADSGVVYHTRHYQGSPEDWPPAVRGLLTHHDSHSLLTLPADHGVRAVALVVCARDRALRVLRHAEPWEAAVRTHRDAAAWIHGEPLTDVHSIAGLQDTTRSYVVDGTPVLTGLLPVGDAWAATNPFLGRGITLGALHARLLAEVVGEGHAPGGTDLARRFDEATAREVGPLVAMTVAFGAHRLAELEAEAIGVPYRTDDPGWSRTTALMTGARLDPELARAQCRIASLLAIPPEVMADPDLRARLGPYLAHPRYPAGDGTRADLLRTLGGTGTTLTHRASGRVPSRTGTT